MSRGIGSNSLLFWDQHGIRSRIVCLGFEFLFDQAAGSCTICGTSAAGNSNGAGVTFT